MSTRRVTVVDTGTNSTRMLVADVEGNFLKELARDTQTTRLGEGVQEHGRLSESAMRRVERCFSGFRKKSRFLESDYNLLLATSSVRDAINGEEFIASLAKRAAFDCRILTGEQEAGLAFAGASIGQPQEARLLMMDVGGGSTEVAAGSGGKADYAVSLDLGCVRLKETMLSQDPPEPAEMDAAAAHVQGLLRQAVDIKRLGRPDQALAVAGTATSLAAIDLGLEVYDREQIHGHVMGRERLGEITSRLAAMKPGERRKMAALAKGRADVIVAGALILTGVMESAGIGEIMISENDLLDGAALRYAGGEL
ncbi:MAG TPA: Ppx/GppA family phosphatase [Actinobacteria bacterium]|nr:Ppx/GppA family phosphatase [Actinomycetota bacterium]